MEPKGVKSTFTRLDRDVRPRNSPTGSYPYALNAKKDTESNYSGGLTNELGTKLRGRVQGIVGYHRLEERNSTLFFHLDGASTISIFNHDSDKVTEVVKDTDFGCSWEFDDCRWMGYGHSVSKTLAPCNDLIVYFCSNDYSYKVNIDELLDPKRRESIKNLPEPCEHFKLIRCNSGMRVTIKPNRGGGRDLPPGQYYTCARGIDETGNTSNWTPIEGPAYIGSKYNKHTDISRQSLQIQVRDLPESYSRIEIAVIPPIGSQSQDVAYVIYDGSYNTNGVTAQYYSQAQHKKIIAISDILDKDIKFLRPRNMFQHDGELTLYRTRQEFNPKVQEWARKAEVSIISFAVPASKAHLFKSLPRDEVIALGEERKYCDGTFMPVGHYYGPKGGSNDINCTDCSLPPGQTGNNASLIEEYVTFSTDGNNKLCLIGGQQTTKIEGYSPIQACGEKGITPRSSEENDCVDHETDSEATQGKVDKLQIQPSDLADCIDCNQAKTVNDITQESGSVTNYLEHTTDLFRTDSQVASDCTTGKHSTIIGAAKTLYNAAVNDADKQEEITYRTVVSKQESSTNLKGETKVSVQYFQTTEDCLTEEVEPIVLARYKPGGWESTLTYSRELDCDGQPLHGEDAGLPIRHFKTPGTDLVPLSITVQSGVESRFDPSNTPGKDTYIVMLGLQVDNVYNPSYEKGEIPKPLDANEPFRIVMGQRERHTASKVFAGYVTPTFKGKQGNKEYAVPRHGTCAYPAVDRSIDNNGSHLGEDWDVPIYNLHTPDLHNASEFVSFDYIKVCGILSGEGMVYGLYAKGKEVKDEDNRPDRRGARSALNLSKFEPTKFVTCVKGSEFAEHNTNLQNPEGIDYPLLNKHRESSIYFQTAEALPTIGTNNKDWSFNVGGLDHEYPTTGTAWYVTAHRINTQQYGSLESLQYMDIGLVGRKGQTSVRGLVGDTFVQQWSDKRTSYISDKVGNSLNTDYPITASNEFLGPDTAHQGKDRSVCDYPNRLGMRMKEWLGFFYPQELPANGDKKDPKNMANGHPTLFANQIQGIKLQADTDLFFARTLTHLNYLTVESDTNLKYRSTGRPETREVFAEELQGLDLDSSINKQDPEDCWLNDWHNVQLQPSKKQKEKKAKVRFLIGIVFPLVLMGLFATVSTGLEAGTTALFGGGGMIIMYLVLVRNILSGKKLDKFLGIPECKTDDEGAQDENNTRGLKDNWNDYNWGFSDVNDLNFFFGMPHNYNTCKCTSLSNLLYRSNTQIHTSPYDAYMNFQALSYSGVPAESGELQTIFVWGNNVYAQTTDGLLLIQGNNGWNPQPPRVLEGVFEGFGGTTDPNSTAICKYGVIGAEYEAKDITIFNGQFKSVVKNSGLQKYWKENFDFCGSGCRDNFNPSGVHFTFGYDPEHELLLITKKDGDKGFTWSYDIETATYVSKHSYVPDFYFWDRRKLYSVKDGNIYSHNDGPYSTYYGQAYPFIVDAIVNASGDTFEYDHSILDTEVNHLVDGKPILLDREETFDHVSTRTDFIQTGRLPLELEDQDDGSETVKNKISIPLSRRTTGKWQFNKVKSWEHDRDVPMTIPQTCGDVELFNDSNVTDDSTAHKTKKLQGKFLHQRFEFNSNDKQIIVFGLETFISPT